MPARRISRQQHLRGIFSSQSGDEGTCGTCGMPALATSENEGYSYCCNDRIEYGAEASDTVASMIREREECVEQDKRKIASLASKVSRMRRQGSTNELTATEHELANRRAWMRNNKAELKALRARYQRGF